MKCGDGKKEGNKKEEEEEVEKEVKEMKVRIIPYLHDEERKARQQGKVGNFEGGFGIKTQELIRLEP